MKNLILISLLLIDVNILVGQEPIDYPYITFVDNAGFLYVSADTALSSNHRNILVKKVQWERFDMENMDT